MISRFKIILGSVSPRKTIDGRNRPAFSVEPVNGVDENFFRQTWIKAFRFGLPAQNPGISQTSWHRRAPDHGDTWSLPHATPVQRAGMDRSGKTCLGKEARLYD